jgi:hypothetical protein
MDLLAIISSLFPSKQTSIEKENGIEGLYSRTTSRRMTIHSKKAGDITIDVVISKEDRARAFSNAYNKIVLGNEK